LNNFIKNNSKWLRSLHLAIKVKISSLKLTLNSIFIDKNKSQLDSRLGSPGPGEYDQSKVNFVKDKTP
jgi:hypothetical protein